MATYTLKPGHQRTFLLGIARAAGETVQIDKPDDLSTCEKDMLAAHFNCITDDNAKPQNAKGKPLRNGLTRQQALQKLQAANITFAEDLDNDALADLYEKAFAVPETNKPDNASGPSANEQKKK